MAIRKEYKYGADAREAIRKVSTSIGDTLGKTLGPAGRNFQTPEGITNDGRSILSHIRFADECEDSVALAFHEVANRQDKDMGDGTTTAVVIATKLTELLIQDVPDLDTPIPGQESVMSLSRRLEEEKDRAIELLAKKVTPVTTLEQLEQVAFTAMEDKEVAKVIAKTIFEAGKDSFTALEEGFSGKLETNIQAGIEMPLKLNLGTTAEAHDCPVLVVNHIFEDYRELSPFMESMVEAMNQHKVKFEALVIVTKKFSIPFIQKVAEVNRLSAMKVYCMSNDHLPDDIFEDVAAFVDAKYIDTHPKGGNKITDVKFNYCGIVTKFVANPKGAVFYGGKGTQLQPAKETTRVQARILQLNEELSKESNPTNRKALERRIAEFSGGKATIYVDAKTAAEKYYLKLKVEDCMNSCKSALEGGMVRGGGLSLEEVADELGADTLLAQALVEPHRRIQQNAGGVLEIGEDVLDSYLCAKAGIENAVSVVKTVLTIEGVISDHVPSMVEELKEAVS
jgi:chaperonin GroEL